MKKVLTALLALLMFMTMSTGVYAEGDDPDPAEIPRSERGTVQVKLQDPEEGVYHVTVDWGDLRFTYDAGTWDPEYMIYSSGAWRTRSDTDAVHAEIKVTSKSNRAVHVGFKWQSADDVYGGTSGDNGAIFGLSEDTVSLQPALGEAQSVTCQVTPSGNPGEHPGHWGSSFTASEEIVVEIRKIPFT
jgi:hypothetical protein